MRLDPDFALQTRVSLGPRGVYGWIATVVLTLLWLSGGSSEETARNLVAISFMCLFVALPYGAIHVRLLESRGHLDLHRLHGRPPAVALGWLLAGGSWWLLAAGAALFVAAATAGAMDGLGAVATVTCSAAVAAILLALPSRTSAAWLWLILAPALGGLLTAARVQGSRPLVFASVASAAIVTAFAAPAAVALIARAGGPGGSRFSRGRRLGEFARTRFPELTRGLMSTEKPAVAAAVAALMPLLVFAVVRRPRPEARVWSFVALAYGPLLGIAFMLSSRARTERESGGLERMRVSSQAPWRALGELTLGVAAPLLVMAGAAIVTMLVLDPRTALYVLKPWPVLLVTIAALGLVEGLRSRHIGVCIAPAMMIVTVLATSNDATRWLALSLVAWIPAALAVASAQGLEAEVLPPAMACAAVASTAAWLGVQSEAWQSISWGAGVLCLIAPFLMPPPRRRSWTTLALCAAIALMAAASAARLFGAAYPNVSPTGPLWIRNRTVVALLVGALCSSGFVLGWLSSQLSNRGWSLAVRWVPLVVSWIVWKIYLFEIVSWLKPFSARWGASVFLLLDIAYLIGLVVMILVLAAVTAPRRE